MALRVARPVNRYVARPMSRYVARRVLWGIALLFLVALLTFVFFYILPNANGATLRAGPRPSAAVLAQVTQALGLGKPIYTQFWDYLKGLVLHFDLGYSYVSGQPVRELIFDRLPATLSLIAGVVVLWPAVGIALAVVCAARRGRLIDRAAMGTAIVLNSTPAFWLGLILLLLFASDIGKLPILPGASSYVGLTVSPGRWFTALILPWLTLAAGQAAISSRLLRDNLVAVMDSDYIRAELASGSAEWRVRWRHAVRVAITPMTAILGVEIGGLLGGAILVETVFSIPGIGSLNYQAAAAGDLSVLEGTVLVAAMFVVVLGVLADIAHVWLDPRARSS